MRWNVARITDGALLRAQLVYGTFPSECLPSICAKTRGSLKIIEFIASFWEGRGSPQLGKIKSGNQPTGSIFAGFERSWLELVSLWKDLQSDSGVSRFLAHKSVTWLWHFLYRFTPVCVSKVGPIHQCARAYLYELRLATLILWRGWKHQSPAWSFISDLRCLAPSRAAKND